MEELQEIDKDLIISKLTIGTRVQEVEGIIALDPPEEDIYYWTIEYKDGTQIFTTEPVTVIYSKQEQGGEVIDIAKVLKSVK